jgi:large subunit ribosomal protein L10
MAISRGKKQSLVTELVELFDSSKGAVGAAYTGLSVADIQKLRAMAREAGVTVKVAKNRLVRVAFTQSSKGKEANTEALQGQLIYAFSQEDEVAPAQVFAKFAKTNPDLKLIVGFDAEGAVLDTATVTAIANLPTKDQLRGQLVGVLAAPLSGFMTVVSGNQRGLVQVLNQRSETI